MERRTKWKQHKNEKYCAHKNNKLNKLYVSADVAGAHINPVETLEIIHEVGTALQKEPAKDLFVNSTWRLISDSRYDCKSI